MSDIRDITQMPYDVAVREATNERGIYTEKITACYVTLNRAVAETRNWLKATKNMDQDDPALQIAVYRFNHRLWYVFRANGLAHLELRDAVATRVEQCYISFALRDFIPLHRQLDYKDKILVALLLEELQVDVRLSKQIVHQAIIGGEKLVYQPDKPVFDARQGKVVDVIDLGDDVAVKIDFHTEDGPERVVKLLDYVVLAD